MPEAGVGEQAGAALGVVDDRDLEQPVVRVLAAEQLPGEEGEVGEVVDDGLGDAPAGVADDERLAEPEPRMIAGSTRWSRQVTISICAVGGPSGAGA
jgi:hypothetical protein